MFESEFEVHACWDLTYHVVIVRVTKLNTYLLTYLYGAKHRSTKIHDVVCLGLPSCAWAFIIRRVHRSLNYRFPYIVKQHNSDRSVFGSDTDQQPRPVARSSLVLLDEVFVNRCAMPSVAEQHIKTTLHGDCRWVDEQQTYRNVFDGPRSVPSTVLHFRHYVEDELDSWRNKGIILRAWPT